VPIPVSKSARPNTTSSVPSGSTSTLGAKSSANGPGWSIRTGGDQLAPRSVVRENSNELVPGKVSRKLAQAI
jgi:hypothetical protein